jgi:hypothetical protein
MFVITRQRAHKVRQLQPPPGDGAGTFRLLGYRQHRGAPAPGGIDLFEALWDAQLCDPGVIGVGEEEARAWLEGSSTTVLLPLAAPAPAGQEGP